MGATGNMKERIDFLDIIQPHVFDLKRFGDWTLRPFLG
jgi:hypothetical protein